MSGNISAVFDGADIRISKGYRAIANYIKSNPDKVVNMTAASLGAAVGVSESTVVRFAAFLGYRGYPEFVSELGKYVSGKLTSVQRIEMSDGSDDTEKLIENVIESDIANIRATANYIDREQFEKAVDIFTSARKIYVIGMRSSKALAEFMGFYFNLIFDDVCVIKSSGESDINDNLLKLSADDAVVLISFPRYSSGIIEAAKFAKERNAKAVVITDSSLSPLLKYATASIFAKSGIVSFADSLVAPMCLINSLIAAVSLRKKVELKESLSKLEKVWSEHGVYEKADGGNE